MAVNWMWDRKVGYVKDINGNKISLYEGINADLVLLYEYKENGVEKYTFYGYVEDAKHLKNMLENGFAKDAVKFVFTNKASKQSLQHVMLLAKYGVKISIN